MSEQTRPNIVFIMTDDHAAHAMSCYGSRINKTPHMDRIANEGVRFDNAFCTNAICTPSRASILSGTYNHVNGVTTLNCGMDNRIMTFPKLLKARGYQTAIVGKWHLGAGPTHDPSGFDYWQVLPGQGAYHDPVMNEMGVDRKHDGYCTDLITDFSLDWLDKRDKERPFMLMVHHKAPHRPWQPDAKHADMYEDEEIPYPETFDDDYATRCGAAADAKMRVADHMTLTDLKVEPPAGLSPTEQKKWNYQRYIKDYLRCVAAVDDNVGRVLDYLDAEGLTEDTIVVYTSDQGFFLGDHGWYDKRFMYEESLRMPYVMRYPRLIKPGSVSSEMILNVDFAPTFLELAGLEAPDFMQGSSFAPILAGETPADWQQAMYYRYWMHGSHHNVWAHYGVRTHRYKLIYFYADPLEHVSPDECAKGDWERHEPAWELYDLEKDVKEIRNVFHDPEYATVRAEMIELLDTLQSRVGDTAYTPAGASQPHPVV